MAQPPAAPHPSLLLGLARFVPALLVYAASIVVQGVPAAALLLVGDALILTAICAGIGFEPEAGYLRNVRRRGLAALILLVLYALVLAALLALPLWWLWREPSLLAALAASSALLVGLLLQWRTWPAFVLPLVWDEAYPDDRNDAGIVSAIRRSLQYARQLTDDYDLFFSHGLLSALSILLIVAGALALAVGGELLEERLRVSAIVSYALVAVPLASLVAATRCVSALYVDARAQRALRVQDEEADTPIPVPMHVSPVEAALDVHARLLAAARSGEVEQAIEALERGADPNTVPAANDRDQRSVLMHAVLLPDLRLLRALIARGVDINRVHAGISPLIAATRDSFQGRPDAIMTLLANGADPSCTDAEQNTVLHHAALCGEPIVAALLIDAGVDINAVNREGLTALGIACANANWTLASFLLERGARPDVEHAQPALLLAATLADDDASGVRMLLRRKAAVDVRGKLDRTALMAAALDGHVQIAEALLAAGAGADLVDRNGITALMEAARSGSVAIIRALGKRKVDADRTDALGRTALMIACSARAGSEVAVRALLSIGAERILRARDGRRAVDFAAAAGRWPIVNLLDPEYELPGAVAANAAADDENARTRLLDALRFGHWQVVESMCEAANALTASERAQLYLDLHAAEHAAARDWVCNQGLDAEARLDSGMLLTDALFEALPESAPALQHLLRRGVSIGGAAVVARVLATALAAEDVRPSITLAAELIANGGDCLGRINGEVGALHLACALGQSGLVSALLARGLDPNGRDARGRMPLHEILTAATPVAVDMARQLIAMGADPERAAASGETALGLALSRGDRELVHWLNWPRWRLPVRPLKPADLPAAAAAGDIDAVDKLLALGFPIGSVDAQGASALIRAAGSGYAALVVRLLEAGADPDQGSYSGATCLSAAVAARREAVMQTLLERGVNADQRLPGGGTPLMIASALGLPRFAAALLAHGADANGTDERYNTCLQAAAQFAFDSSDTATAIELIELLLRRGARANARNQAGQDALLLLLGARADPGTPCDAVHLARLAGVLVEHGAAVDVQDSRGVSPLHCCAMHGLLGVARLLKAHGAPLPQVDGLGRTAGEIAALLGYVDVAAELGVVRNPVPSPRLTLRKRSLD